MNEKRYAGRDGYISSISKRVAFKGVKRINNIRISIPRLKPMKNAIGIESFFLNETIGFRSKSALAFALFPL